jgi:hypothetical protein
MGLNNHGMLGNGSYTPSSSPSQIAGCWRSFLLEDIMVLVLSVMELFGLGKRNPAWTTWYKL